MDDVKDKLKGFVKKINNPFVTSTRFKGEGHKLGSAQDLPSSAASSGSANGAEKKQGKTQSGDQKQQQGDWKRLQQERWERERGSGPRSAPSGPQHPKASSGNVTILPAGSSNVSLDLPKDVQVRNGSYEHGLQAQKVGHEEASASNLHTALDGMEIATGFDPFRSHIGKSSDRNVGALEMFQCPVCGSWWKSEKEVTAHVEDCLNQADSATSEDKREISNVEESTKVSLGILFSGGPSNATLDVMMRILRNIANSPESEKFRKIRMNNPKILDTVGMALGGVELLEAVGFKIETEGDEIWAVMEPPSVDQIRAMKAVITELETQALGPALTGGGSREDPSSNESPVINRKVDRQVRVFFAAPENLAAKMELPDSFFERSASELRQEAAARRKKLEDSQLLIPKSFREKQAAASKARYKAAIIRIQFPDGVILQGMFLPWEPTSAIYEFVSLSLRDPSSRFDLVAPGQSKSQIIPTFSDGTTKIPTLQEADLVPATLVKFQYSEAEPLAFTGLHSALLAASEPLSSTALPMK